MKKPLNLLILAVFALVLTSVVSSAFHDESAYEYYQKFSSQLQSGESLFSEEMISSVISEELSEAASVSTAVASAAGSPASSVTISSTALVSSRMSSSTAPSALSSKTSVTTASSASTASASSVIPSAAVSSRPVSSETVSATIPSLESSSSQSSSFVSEVIRLINVERAKEGLSALTETSALATAANTRAGEIMASFAHQRPDGRSWSTVLADNGIIYTAAGENIAAGQPTPAQVVEGWMNSPGHRANILNAGYKKIGVGYVSGGEYGHYWDQLFTN